METAAEKEELRSGIEAQFNGAREKLTHEFVADRTARLEQYNNDVRENQKAKEAAFAEAGLNPDGSTPPPAREVPAPEYGAPAPAIVPES